MNKNILLTLPIFISLTACVSKPIDVSSFSIKIEGENYIGVNEYSNLKCLDNNDNELEDVTWSSNDSSIATVSSIGIVKGVAYGECNIVAKYKSYTADYKITVGDSKAIDVVFSRYMNATSYTIDYDYSLYLQDKSYKMKAKERITDDSYSYLIDDNPLISSFNLAKTKDGEPFVFSIKNNKVTDAYYDRDERDSYSKSYYSLKDSSTKFLNAPIYESEDEENEEGNNTYDITNFVSSSKLLKIFFQHGAEDPSNATSNYKTHLEEYYTPLLKTLTLTINDPYSFSIKAFFNARNYVVASYSLLNRTMIDELASFSSTPSYPTTYSEVVDFKNLVSKVNYVQEYGTFKDGETSKDIGGNYYTENYIYRNYSDDYLKKVNADGKNPNYGYLNKDNKVYKFTVENNSINVSKENEKDEDGKDYTSYLEMFSSPTYLINEFFNNKKDYTFQPIETLFGKNRNLNEYYSLSKLADNLGNEILSSDYKNAGYQAVGLAIGINSTDTSDTKIGIGSIVAAIDLGTYIFDYKLFDKFGKADVELIDNYLARK